MDFSTTIWGTIAAVGVFTLIGAWLLVQSFRDNPETAARASEKRIDPPKSAADMMRRYIGPIEPEHAFLNAPLRVLVEGVCSLCGIPGLGWMSSTRVAIGLPLLCIAPAFIYGFVPVILALSGHLADSPYIALSYLPIVCFVSTTGLAIVEIRAAREARGAAKAASHAA